MCNMKTLLLFRLLLLCVLAFLRIRHRRKKYYLISAALPGTQHSSWESLWRSGDEGSLINITRFDYKTFMAIHDVIQPDLVIDKGWKTKGGRPNKLHTTAYLGMALYYLTSTLAIKTLSQIFSTSPTSTQRILKITLKALQTHLPKMQAARIQWPSLVSKVDRKFKHIFGKTSKKSLARERERELELEYITCTCTCVCVSHLQCTCVLVCGYFCA